MVNKVEYIVDEDYRFSHRIAAVVWLKFTQMWNA